MIASLLGAGAGILGSLFGASSNRKAAKMAAAEAAANRAAVVSANNAARAEARRVERIALADKAQDRALQREFAKSGIQWRTEDAMKAGIHPAFAIGAQGASYSPSPVQVGGAPVAAVTSSSDAPRYMAEMGQDIGRAITATRSLVDRDNAYTTAVQGLSLQKLGLENQLLASQIAKLRGQTGPAMPGGGKSSAGSGSSKLAGVELRHASDTSSAEDFENRYGEFAGDIAGLGILWRDYMHTTGGDTKVLDKLIPWIDRNVKVGVPSWNPFRRSPGAGRFGYDGRTGGSF